MKIACARPCPLCGQPSLLDVDPELGRRIIEWNDDPNPHKPYVQVAFPDLTADQREQLLTGAHGECFDLAFPPED